MHHLYQPRHVLLHVRHHLTHLRQQLTIGQHVPQQDKRRETSLTFAQPCHCEPDDRHDALVWDLPEYHALWNLQISLDLGQNRASAAVHWISGDSTAPETTHNPAYSHP